MPRPFRTSLLVALLLSLPALSDSAGFQSADTRTGTVPAQRSSPVPIRLPRLFGAPVRLPLPSAGERAEADTRARAIEPRAVERLQDHAGAVVEVRTTAIATGETVASLGARRSGSGVILDPTTVLTVDYLLLEADHVEIVTASGQRVPGSVAGHDPASGLGLVRTALPLEGPALELGNSEDLLEREKVFTRSHGEPVATELVVVARKPFVGAWEYLLENAIFTFPPVNDWSGAALMTADGKLVGIGSLIVHDAAATDTAVPGNMFVPIDLLKPILADLLARGRRDGPARPWLGTVTESVSGNLMIAYTTPNSPAEQAGLVPGDIVLSVGEGRVADQADFYRRVWQTGSAGSVIPLRVLHGGVLRDVQVRSIALADFLQQPGGI